MTHDGLFAHNVMPFGLVKIITTLENRKRIISYVDEVIITTASVDEGVHLLKQFLEAS